MENFNRSNNFFKSLDVVFIALFSAQILFMLVSYFLVREEIVNPVSGSSGEIKIVVSILTVSLVLITKLFPRFKTVDRDDLKVVLERYRILVLMRLVFIDAAVLMNIVVFLIVRDYIFLLIAIILLILFFAYRPSKEGMIKEFQLDRGKLTDFN